MTNFDYLKTESKFSSFVDAAIIAERVFEIDPSSCAANCRKAMELAIKWMYSVDKTLKKPYQETLSSLMSTDDFHDIVDDDLWKRLDLIRKIGNRAIHSESKPVSRDEAILCLKNLHIFFDFIYYCYGDNYKEVAFDESLLSEDKSYSAMPLTFSNVNLAAFKDAKLKDIKLDTMIAKNKAYSAELTQRRVTKYDNYVPKPLELSEFDTRHIYIDEMLRDAGWIEGKNWVNEVEIEGMPNKSKKGRIDYVLYDDSHIPLAIVEAKKTCVDVASGRQQAKLYADILEKQTGRRPVIFLTNGFDTRIIDNQYPERKVSNIYSKRDLEKLFNLRTMKTSLSNINVDKNIAGRYYQEAAVKAVCDSFGKRNRRKALLVMATGSGKTRTIIALCKLLLDEGWVKNILFLADRNALVTQAKRSFVNLLPDLSCTNLCEDKENYNAHCVLSTYQTMIGCIDSVKDDDGRIFSCGHFDLIICDEAHRSIYNKYKDIFTYFDAPLVGLTATPKDDIDKNTYALFDLEYENGQGVPTYGYDLADAVKDGYLVDFLSVETRLKFIEDGIVYDELSEEDKEEYERTFANDNGDIPEKIDSSALNTWLFNEDTIRQVLHIVMDEGLKIEYGQKIGKTIIFAKNHDHAEKILEVFNKEYPHLTKNGQEFAKVIDNYINYAQSAIDEFSDSKKMPQIAISVDMLDTGIDVPEILNLVFFKKVMSKAKFWQMIGRGTRLCEGLIDGENKSKFYIFDFCGNFEFFRMNKGKPSANMMALQSSIFNLKFQIAYSLQNADGQTARLIDFRNKLVEMMSDKVKELNRDNFAVKQHLKYVEHYSNPVNYNSISYEDTLLIKEEVAPLVLPDDDEVSAVRFDALIYGLELAQLNGKSYGKAKSDLMKKVKGISMISNIPEIQVKSELIDRILHTDYIERAGLDELEYVRENLRNLMKYLPKPISVRYDTDFSDDILSVEWNDSELENESLKNYKAKAEYYIRQHQDNIVIAKLKTNKPLTEDDIKTLESILWSDLGTKEDYEKEYGTKPLGEFVREIVGLDMNAAKEAFSDFLNDSNLDSRQIYFVNQIVEYIVHNGLLKDFSVLQESPFTDRGSVVEIFTDLNVWAKIRNVIEQINANAA